MANEPQPIQEEDYPVFMQWVNSQPAGAIVGTTCHLGDCPVARWYSTKIDGPVYVSILKHFLSYEELCSHTYQYNPSWVQNVAIATDQYGELEREPITQEEFITQVLPMAYRFGLPEWKG